MTHTPGPWIVTKGHPVTKWCVIVAGTPQLVADVATEPDARLIAQAPAMLAQLRKLVARLDDYGIRTNNLEADAKEARAILRAVEGS
jgi:hypothetical protein